VLTVGVIVGVATWYAGVYVGQPRICGGTYDATAGPWVALPAREFGQSWQCGDLVALWFVDEQQVVMARALDAGPFGAHCVVIDGQCVDIVVDVPRHLWPVDGLSAQVQVVNVTAACRERGRCD